MSEKQHSMDSALAELAPISAQVDAGATLKTVDKVLDAAGQSQLITISVQNIHTFFYRPEGRERGPPSQYGDLGLEHTLANDHCPRADGPYAEDRTGNPAFRGRHAMADEGARRTG